MANVIFFFPENEYLNKLLFNVFDENDYYKLNITSEFNSLFVFQEIEENLQDYIDSYKYMKN